jgi:hypothetical protein
MGASIARARQGFSVRRFTTALVVLVCLSAPVAGASGTAASTGANTDSIGPTESGVHAQTGPLVAANGSVTINETRTNRTQGVLDSVTLPQNGYIVARTNVSANQSGGAVVGHTQYVRNGTFKDVVLDLNKSVRGSKTLSVALYNDTNGDETLNITGNGTTDAPYRTANGTPIRDSVQIGANGSENGTQSQNTTSTNASVSISNQTTNGSTVTVQSVTLAQPGYVAIHTSAYATGPAPADVSVIAVSQRLSAGHHQNVTIDISNAPPGNAPGLNQSQLNETQTLAAAVYADTNGNHRYDYVRSFGRNDTLITNNGSPVHDAARVRVPSPPQPTASVIFRNQTLHNRTLVVERARLPDGGYLVAHNASYQRGGNPVTSVVGVSKYLAPGNHTTITIDVSKTALARTQTVTVRPARDTNDNQRYDYVRSQGFRDVAYETRNHSATIADPARIRVPVSQQATPAQTTSPTAEPSTAGSRGEIGSSDGFFDSFGMTSIVGILVVFVGAVLIAREVR